MKLETQEEVNKLSKKAIETAKQSGVNVKEDEFRVIQPYKNGQSIIFSVVENEETGERTIRVDANDSTFILDAIDKELDIFS